jgi:hypothetical protein
MPNITRGDSFHKLMRYLVGPGRRNEHVLPHVVAGGVPSMPWREPVELSQTAAARLAGELEMPTRVRGAGPKAGAVWHCSLSLPAEDGLFTDEQWAKVAHDFLDKMGWSPEASGRAPMPWVAVHHGQSAAGNDHIHLVVSMVRDDGTFVNAHNDQIRAQRACRDLEAELGVRRVEGRVLGLGEPGLKPGEVAIAGRTGREPSRRTLERQVRAAATGAATEAEFVEAVRVAGLRIAPYFAAGRGDVIAGYKVGLRGDGERMFGGGHLSRDLTLPRLRARWADTPEAHLAAAQAWRVVDGEQQATGGGSSSQRRASVDPDVVNRAMWEQRERLRSLDPADTLAWSTVAADVAGVLSAWSSEVERGRPGPIAGAARSVGRLAQFRRVTAVGSRPLRASNTGATLLALSISRGGQGTVAQAIFLRQLMNTMKAIHDAAQAMGQLQIAQAIHDSAVYDLEALRTSLPDIPDHAFRGGCPTVADAETAIAATDATGDVHNRVAGGVGLVRPSGRPLPEGPADRSVSAGQRHRNLEW